MKQNKDKKINSFSYNFEKKYYVLSAIALALAVAGIVSSAIRLAKTGINGFYDVLRFPLLILICVFAIVIVVSLLIKSQYVITEKYIVSKFGIITSKMDVNKITNVTFDMQTGKTTLNFGEEFVVFSLKKDDNEPFIRAILQANPEVEYSYTLTENKE